MPDEPQRFTVQGAASWALWPGNAMMVARISVEHVKHDLLYLIDRYDNAHEMRPYRYGSLARNQRWPSR